VRAIFADAGGRHLGAAGRQERLDDQRLEVVHGGIAAERFAPPGKRQLVLPHCLRLQRPQRGVLVLQNISK
jgi:hypothetical protein